MLETSDNYNNYVQYLPQKYIEKVCTTFEVNTVHNYYNCLMFQALDFCFYLHVYLSTLIFKQ
jgi:hypothetical protein